MFATWPRPRIWTKAEYHDLAERGIFDGQRVELIGGEVIEMPPQKDEHAMAVSLVNYALLKVFAKGYLVRVQMPMNLGAESEPEPDVLVVRGSARSVVHHPKSALLVVEVAGSTLHFDQGRKASLYARHRVNDYWIVNLPEQKLEVRRRIVADGSEPFGFRYEELDVLEVGDVVAPLASPRSKIAVADLLP